MCALVSYLSYVNMNMFLFPITAQVALNHQVAFVETLTFFFIFSAAFSSTLRLLATTKSKVGQFAARQTFSLLSLFFIV